MDLVLFEEIAIEVGKTGIVQDSHVAAARRNVYPDGAISRFEAEGIYAIERARRSPSALWSAFFVEAIRDHILTEPPIGYLSEENASWLKDQIARRKHPTLDGDMPLVTEVIEKAREVPWSFSGFALRLVKEAVLYGDGPDAHGVIHSPGRVDDADIAMMKRVIWGAGGEGQLAISRDEAEALFDIADATTGASNSQAFDDFFARAVGNYLMGATGRAVPTRQEALQWTTRGDYKMNVLNAMSRMLQPTVDDLLEGLAMRSPDEDVFRATELHHAEANLRRELAEIEARAVVPEEAQWLLDRVNRNGMTSPAEKALLRFIAREGSTSDPALKSLLAKVA